MKVYEEKIGNKYRYFIGKEEKNKDGTKTLTHLSGYFMSRKEAERRLERINGKQV